MTMPPLPYDLAEAVRVARQKRIDELQLRTAHPQLHGKQHAGDKAATDVDGPAPSSEVVGPGAAPSDVKRLQRLIRGDGRQQSTDEPKPWKKPWDR